MITFCMPSNRPGLVEGFILQANSLQVPYSISVVCNGPKFPRMPDPYKGAAFYTVANKLTKGTLFNYSAARALSVAQAPDGPVVITDDDIRYRAATKTSGGNALDIINGLVPRLQEFAAIQLRPSLGGAPSGTRVVPILNGTLETYRGILSTRERYLACSRIGERHRFGACEDTAFMLAVWAKTGMPLGKRFNVPATRSNSPNRFDNGNPNYEKEYILKVGTLAALQGDYTLGQTLTDRLLISVKEAMPDE